MGRLERKKWRDAGFGRARQLTRTKNSRMPRKDGNETQVAQQQPAGEIADQGSAHSRYACGLPKRPGHYRIERATQGAQEHGTPVDRDLGGGGLCGVRSPYGEILAREQSRQAR